MAGGVFISYRRNDAAHVAGRVADALAARIGRERVFVDVDSVAPGEDFVRKIESTIDASETLLAIIGPNWLNATDAEGRRRIDLDGDFIRLEIRSALTAGVRVIPVLVDGAAMPKAEDLPEDLRDLVRRNAAVLNHISFTRDVQALVDQLAAPPKRKMPKAALLALPLGAGVIVIAAIAFALVPRAPPPLTTSVGLTEDDAPADQWMHETRYKAERASGGRMSIRAQLPYRDRMREEQRIDGVSYLSGSPLQSPMPTLLVQVTNISEAPVTVSEIQFEVIRAEPDLAPLPVLREHRADVHRIRLVDEGWGVIDSPRLTISAWGLPETDRAKIDRTWKGVVTSPEPCAEPARLTEVTPFTIEGAPQDKATYFELEGHIPPALETGEFVCAIGRLAFNSSAGPQDLAIRTRVSNREPNAVVASPARSMYDLYLDPDREGYVAVVPVVREIAPGATEAIRIKIISDKSSDFELRQLVRTTTGEPIPGETFDLQIFKSRNFTAGYRLNPQLMKRLPPEAIAAADPSGLIESVLYDPNGRDEARINLSRDLEDAACQRFVNDVSERLLASVGGVPVKGVVATGPGSFYCWLDDAP